MIIKDGLNGIDIEIDTKKGSVTLKDGFNIRDSEGITFPFETWAGLNKMIDKMILVSKNIKQGE